MGHVNEQVILLMSFLKSKGFWATIATTVIVMAIVNRVPMIRSVVVGA